MKKIFLCLVIGVSLAACDNSANSEAGRKDSLDSIANEKKDRLDSTTEVKKDRIDSTTENQKEALDKMDSMNRVKDSVH